MVVAIVIRGDHGIMKIFRGFYSSFGVESADFRGFYWSFREVSVDVMGGIGVVSWGFKNFNWF